MIDKETDDQLLAKKREFARIAMDAEAYIAEVSTSPSTGRLAGAGLHSTKDLRRGLREMALRLYPKIAEEKR